MRLNIWLDETNFLRMQSILGDILSGKLNTANTVFCLFAPDAPGISKDSFPTEASVHYGSRTGTIYPHCITHGADRKQRPDRYWARFFQKRRLEDLGETESDPALIQRMIWEGKNANDGPGLARVMRDLVAAHPLKDGASESVPVLPVMPDLAQTINLCAADSRAVVALVLPKEGKDTMTAPLTRLLFEEGIAGRVHMVRMTEAEWAAAKASQTVRGSELASGVMFLHPNAFGRHAETQVEVPTTVDEAQLRRELSAALQHFHGTWRKGDRKAHLRQGVVEEAFWREWDPITGTFIDIIPQLSAIDRWFGKQQPTDEKD